MDFLSKYSPQILGVAAHRCRAFCSSNMALMKIVAFPCARMVGHGRAADP